MSVPVTPISLLPKIEMKYLGRCKRCGGYPVFIQDDGGWYLTKYGIKCNKCGAAKGVNIPMVKTNNYDTNITEAHNLLVNYWKQHMAINIPKITADSEEEKKCAEQVIVKMIYGVTI